MLPTPTNQCLKDKEGTNNKVMAAMKLELVQYGVRGENGYYVKLQKKEKTEVSLGILGTSIQDHSITYYVQMKGEMPDLSTTIGQWFDFDPELYKVREEEEIKNGKKNTYKWCYAK